VWEKSVSFEKSYFGQTEFCVCSLPLSNKHARVDKGVVFGWGGLCWNFLEFGMLRGGLIWCEIWGKLKRFRGLFLSWKRILMIFEWILNHFGGFWIGSKSFGNFKFLVIFEQIFAIYQFFSHSLPFNSLLQILSKNRIQKTGNLN
jgi:hypothetical protein